MSFCAPSRAKQQWTCFTLDELQTLATAYNKTTPGRKDPIDLHIIVGSKDKSEDFKKTLWFALRNKFAPYCGDNEACWLDSIDLGKQLKSTSPQAYKILNYFTLKPKGTKQKYGWLSTTEIDYVMLQYQELFPDFKYIGCYPSDYYKLAPSKFPKKLLDTYKNAGIVFNLDSSHQKGSHWIAIYITTDPLTKRKTVEFFDPTGKPPNKNLNEFLKNPYFKDADVYISKKVHQRGNSECGVYSLFYILQRAKGRTMEDINSKRIADSEMNNLRTTIFRPYSEKFHM